MDWHHLLAYLTGTVDQERLVRHESLVTDNRLLRHQIQGRLRWRDGERTPLAERGQKLGKQALEDVATIVKPATILAWHRTLVAQKCDGSPPRKAPGRPTIDQELEAFMVRMAQEHRSWGSDRIIGALATLGLTVSAQTGGNVLKRHGMAPAPERKTTTTWKECIRTPLDVLVATDCFTAEVWTLGGLVTYHVLFVIHVGSRQGQVAGGTPPPHEAWMIQVARHITMEQSGFLSPGQDLIHDRDGQDGPALQPIMDGAGGKRVPLPPRLPHLNAYAERWVRSVTEECLSRLILGGEASLRHALAQYGAHGHHERHHQGTDNVLLLPVVSRDRECQPGIRMKLSADSLHEDESFALVLQTVTEDLRRVAFAHRLGRQTFGSLTGLLQEVVQFACRLKDGLEPAELTLGNVGRISGDSARVGTATTGSPASADTAHNSTECGASVHTDNIK